MSSSWDVTTTCSAVAVPGVAVLDGVGLAADGAGLCAIARRAPKSSVIAAIKTFFIGIYEKWIFQRFGSGRGVCAKRLSIWIGRLAQAPLQLFATQLGYKILMLGENASSCVLTERRWRVRIDVRTEKNRLNPDGDEDRGFRKSSRRRRRADKRRMGNVFAGTGGDRSDCTTVLGLARVAVDALM